MEMEELGERWNGAWLGDHWCGLEEQGNILRPPLGRGLGSSMEGIWHSVRRRPPPPVRHRLPQGSCGSQDPCGKCQPCHNLGSREVRPPCAPVCMSVSMIFWVNKYSPGCTISSWPTLPLCCRENKQGQEVQRTSATFQSCRCALCVSQELRQICAASIITNPTLPWMLNGNTVPSTCQL